jgi:hypothetical protein
MPPIDKAKRRDERRRKAINTKYMNVRYRTLRQGKSLAAFEADRTTTIEGKKVRKVRRKK